MNEPADAPAEQIRLFSEGLMAELGEQLAKSGKVARAQIEELSAQMALTGDTLDRILLKESLVSERDILEALSELTHIPFRPVAEFEIDEAVVRSVPAKVAIRYRIMPLTVRDGILLVACHRVPDLTVVNSLRMLLGRPLEWVLCSESDIAQSLKHFYGLGVETVDDVIREKAQIEEPEQQESDFSIDNQSDAGIVRFVNQVISEAIRMDATDIHIEPFESRLRLRYRVDGVLQDIPVPQGIHRLRKAIASCVKIMAQLNIAERRKPHDGRIKVRTGGEEFDLRVSVLPTRFGETVNLRILNRASMFIDLAHLGLRPDQLPILQSLSALPHGILLITGPTGSGKTTTLYATLSRINTKEVKIITVEDPVEYQMDGINQIQVNPQIDLSFASVLRSILRHDPDIILVGEIRDAETADIAVRAALTGHLVFSTLHTNDAASAVARLLDMGIEPYLVSSCLEGVVAQRLVRRICATCRVPMEPDETIKEEIHAALPDLAPDAAFYKGRGCPDCNFTGYRGRIALFEILVMQDELRSMIVHQRPSNEIRNAAIERGLRPLRHSGWCRVQDGTTSVDEVLRVARKFDFATKKLPA